LGDTNIDRITYNGNLAASVSGVELSTRTIGSVYRARENIFSNELAGIPSNG
jgi:hypothetical protein